MPNPFAIQGDIRDETYGGGQFPKADARDEYLAGGSQGFPLHQQIALSRACDDLSRDLGEQVYEVMLYDPTVASAFFVIATAVLNGKLQVVPRYQLQPGEILEELPPAQQAQIAESQWAADFLDRQMRRQPCPIKNTLFEMLYAMAYGCKLAEKIFEEGDEVDAGLICLKRLRTKQNRSWSYIVTPHGDVVAIRGTIVGGQIKDIPPQKFMMLTWMPQDGDPRGRSLLRAAYNGWNLKINSWPKLYKYLDRFGTPITIGTIAPEAPDEPATDERGNPVGGTITATQAMGNQLNRLEGGSWMVVRDGAKVEIFAPTGNGEQFLNAVQIFKHEILEGILMTARATLEAQHGSKADTQEAHHVVARLITMGREALEAMLEKQLWHHLLEINKGKAYADQFLPHASLGDVEAKDIEKIMTAFTGAGWFADPGHFPHIDARFGLIPRKLQAGRPMPIQDPDTGGEPDGV